MYITPDLYKKTKESKASDDLIINIAVIFYLYRPQVKAFFGIPSVTSVLALKIFMHLYFLP